MMTLNKTSMNQKQNLITKIGRSLTLKLAITLAASAVAMSAMPRSASALTYVNLLDGTTSSPAPQATRGQVLPEPLPEPGADNGPSSLSWGATSGAAQNLGNVGAQLQAQQAAQQAAENAARAAAAQVAQAAQQRQAQFNQWAGQLLQARQTAEAQMRANVAAYDQAIYQQWLARERAKYSYQTTGLESERQAYFAAQSAIEQYQKDRWITVTNYTTYTYNIFNTIYGQDPNQQANVSWYQNQLAANQNFYNAVLTQVQSNFGLKAAKYQRLPDSQWTNGMPTANLVAFFDASRPNID